jgi:hypothetical protein
MKMTGYILLLFSVPCSTCWGGEIYGNISEGVTPVRGARVEVQSPGKPTSISDANGAYKVFVPMQGKFPMKVAYGGQTPTITVYSYPRSVRFDLALEKKGANYSLRRK